MNRALNKQPMKNFAVLSAYVWLILALACSAPTSTVDGGGTRGGNPVVAGMIVGKCGTAMTNVRVQLIPADHDPLTDIPIPASCTDTTDALGTFSIVAPDSGIYNIEAVRISDGARHIRFNIAVYRDSTRILPPDTLYAPGSIVIPEPGRNGLDAGHIYIPGTTIGTAIADGADSIVLDPVPSGILPALCYVKNNNGTADTIKVAIQVEPGMAAHIENIQWQYSRKIILNTSPSGAGTGRNVYRFPVLIRLNAGNFVFEQARPDGGDLMFTGNDRTTLPMEIERWDATSGHAEIWVRVDTIYGNNQDQSIKMYWGNPTALPQSDGEWLFDTADGYQGVWHLGDPENDSVRDATTNRYHGGSPASALPASAEGAIGICRRFDGNNDQITMPNTAGGRLSFPEDGFYSVYAWVRLDSFGGKPQLVVAKGYEQYFLRTTYFPSTDPSWEFAEFSESTGWQSSRSPAKGGDWVLLTGVRSGKDQLLYCNGVLVDSVKDVWPRSVSRDVSNDLSVGAFLKEVTIPDDDGYCFLRGSIDELRIIGAAISRDWIRLCYMNQRADDRLVVFQ